MILSLFISGIETTLTTIEAANVIAERLELIANGDPNSLRERELMDGAEDGSIRSDTLAGVSYAIILDSYRVAIRANEVCLRAMQLAT